MKYKIALGLALLSSFAAAGDDTPMAVANMMAASYKKAMMTKDISFFQNGSTADFYYVDAQGRKAAKAQAISGIQGAFQSMKFQSMDEKIVSAKKTKGGVVFVTDSHMVASMSTGGPKPSKMVSSMRDETMVVKQGGRWMYKYVKLLKENDTVDGKPMKM